MKNHLLLIDDTPISLELLMEAFRETDFTYETAEDGQEALDPIKSNSPEHFSAIITDWMMPRFSGLELLQALKLDPERRSIPVIFQTAKIDPLSIQQSVDLGAYYYLTKPLDIDLLISVVSSAVEDYQNHQKLYTELSTVNQSLSFMTQASFQIQRIEECRPLATLLANFCEDPRSMSVALFELFVNGIEHGNLGIDYAEKKSFIFEGTLAKEIKKRLSQEENKTKFVEVNFANINKETIEIHIQDQGEGFDYQNFLSFSPDRASDPNGRGVTLANLSKSHRLEYSEQGRKASLFTQINTAFISSGKEE